MTTIIGRDTHEGCVLAADALTTSDGRPFAGPSIRKIVARGEYLLAASGAGGLCDHITHVWKPPKYTGGAVYDVLTASVVPSLMKSLRNSDMLTGDKEENTFQLLLAVAGEVFQIEADGTVLDDESGLYGIGSGAAYALGAIEAGATLTEALDIAAVYDVYTRAPMQIVRQVR